MAICKRLPATIFCRGHIRGFTSYQSNPASLISWSVLIGPAASVLTATGTVLFVGKYIGDLQNGINVQVAELKASERYTAEVFASAARYQTEANAILLNNFKNEVELMVKVEACRSTKSSSVSSNDRA